MQEVLCLTSYAKQDDMAWDAPPPGTFLGSGSCCLTCTLRGHPVCINSHPKTWPKTDVVCPWKQAFQPIFGKFLEFLPFHRHMPFSGFSVVLSLKVGEKNWFTNWVDESWLMISSLMISPKKSTFGPCPRLAVARSEISVAQPETGLPMWWFQIFP